MAGKPGKGKRPVPLSDRPLGGARKPGSTADVAFDEWLNRGLHNLYDVSTNEPVPEEILRLIAQDRKK